MADWKTELAVAVLVKQALRAADVHEIYPFSLPRVAATSDAVEGAERHLGRRLDGEYREFLLHADGWPHFFQRIDLFGTPELRAEGSLLRAWELIDAAVPSPALHGLDKRDLMPIAFGQNSLDVFVLVNQGAQAGQVVWLAGEEVDSFPSFSEFFLAMIDYNRAELPHIQEISKRPL
ncbi:MAG TPA: SMI1/KNR4 family protein [Tepidisphaeraceae bacterium]|nr:SMI1/KNR4 family protein [Tepidisphaeraceae bacterium]